MDPHFEEAMTRARLAQEASDVKQEAMLSANARRVLFYWSCAVAALVLSASVVIVWWDRLNLFALLGVVLAAVSSVALCMWLLWDMREDVEDCPVWLRILIVNAGWLSVVCFLLGWLIP